MIHRIWILSPKCPHCSTVMQQVRHVEFFCRSCNALFTVDDNAMDSSSLLADGELLCKEVSQEEKDVEVR